MGQTASLFGTTIGAIDDYKTFCADPDASSSAPDVVYQLSFASECTMSLLLHSEPGFEGALDFQTSCGADFYCVAPTLGNAALKLPVLPGSYSVVVDGVNGSSGAFSLDVTCDVPQCGDGVVNSGEDCDGGPGATPGDGCGDPGTPNACKIEQTTAADTCADVVPVAVAAGAHFLLPAVPPPFNLTGASDDYHSVDPSCSPNPAVDQVFGFIPAVDGTLTVTIGRDANGQAYCLQDPIPAGCWNHTLYLREGTCETGTELTCAFPDYVTDDGVITVTAFVSAGVPYYLFVDGEDLSPYDVGPYILDVQLQ